MVMAEGHIVLHLSVCVCMYVRMYVCNILCQAHNFVDHYENSKLIFINDDHIKTASCVDNHITQFKVRVTVALSLEKSLLCLSFRRYSDISRYRSVLLYCIYIAWQNALGSIHQL